ncbi:MAG TPA: GTPase HflX, partial [Lysobacter sp.]
AARLRAQLHELGAVRGERADDDGWVVQLDLAEADAQRLYANAHGHALRALVEPRADAGLA